MNKQFSTWKVRNLNKPRSHWPPNFDIRNKLYQVYFILGRCISSFILIFWGDESVAFYLRWITWTKSHQPFWSMSYKEFRLCQHSEFCIPVYIRPYVSSSWMHGCRHWFEVCCRNMYERRYAYQIPVILSRVLRLFHNNAFEYSWII